MTTPRNVWPERADEDRREALQHAEYGKEELRQARLELRRNQLDVAERHIADTQISLERIARLMERARTHPKI